MTQQTSQTPSPTLLIDLSLISPHDGAVLAHFSDDGTLSTLLAQRIGPSLPLSYWIPDVVETDEWNAANWLIWLEAAQRLANNLVQLSEPKIETKPQSEMTTQELTNAASVNLTTGAGGVTMVTFTILERQPDPQRTLLLTRLADLSAFVTAGQATGGSLLRNNLTAPSVPAVPPDVSPVVIQEAPVPEPQPETQE